MRYPCLLCAGFTLAVGAASHAQVSYPETPRDDAVDVMHGVRVEDPYRWMETESPSVEAWVRAQGDLFRGYVDGLAARDAIERRIGEIGRFERTRSPKRAGERWFVTRTPIGRNAGILYIRDGEAGPERVLVDPETYFTSSGQRLIGNTPSPTGRYAVIGVDDGAGTWGELRILDVDTGEALPDRLIGTSGPTGYSGVFWLGDDSGFVYFHFDVRTPRGERTVALRNPKIRLHFVGTPQTEDPVLFARPDDPNVFATSLDISNDDRYVVFSVIEKGSSWRSLYALDLDDAAKGPTELLRDEARFSYIGSRGSVLWYLTDHDAPNSRLVGIDVTDPDPARWVEIVPEGEDQIASVSQTRDYIVVQYQKDVKPVLRVFDHDGGFLHEADLPGIGGVGISTSRRHNEVYYTFGVLFDPNSIYRLNPSSGRSELHDRPRLAFDPGDFVVEQVFYKSADGTRIPMFIAGRRGLKPDGTRPVWMYAYGHGGWMAFPWFQPHLVAWLEMGGLYALPGIRGGGEYGAEWREAGMRRNKVNTIDDYVAAAEWLIDSGYASPGGVIANGGSASGFLPAVALNRRPDLFAAAVIDWPFLDMLRYHHFASGFTRSFGSPDDAEDFAVLSAYSPYHNLRRDTCYPPTLVAVGEKDVSTPPLHGYKYIAALQHLQACDHPAMIQMIKGAGHYSYGTTIDQRNRSFADQIAFVIRAMGLDFAPPPVVP